MASPIQVARGLLPLAILAGLMSFGHAAPAWATETPYPDPSGEKQCAASDINDSKNVVGSCVPGNATGPAVAWYAATPGTTPTVLQALVTGQSCSASGMINDGIIVGGCVDANNHPFGVIWTSSTAVPIQLQPLSALQTGLLADITTGATGYNQNGAVIGESVSDDGDSTAVLWPSGSGTPIFVSSYADNCSAVDVNATNVNGQPSVALNCPTNPSPGNPGPAFGAIAQYTGLLGSYVVTRLPLPSGATHCTVAGINDALQAVGTCHFPAPDHPQAAFWATPTSTPQLITATQLNARNHGAFINSGGNVVFTYQDSNGDGNAGFWNTTSNTVTVIPDLPGGTRCASVGLGDNNTVALTCETNHEQPEAAEWTSAGGTVALGFMNGGSDSGVTAVNKGGTAAAVNGEGSTENVVGGEAGL